MTRLHRLAPLATLALIVLAAPGTAQVPAWLQEHMADLAAGSGTWIADNASYVSDQETDDAYATRWEWGLGQKSLRGVLYGMKNGEKTGTYWEYRIYWDPSRHEAVMIQWGVGGAVGAGTVTAAGAHRTESDQVFTWPDGSSNRQRHLMAFTADAHTTETHNWADGEWKPGRTYEWRLVR